MAKTKELKKSPFMGREEGEESSSQFWKRAVSRERLFLSARHTLNSNNNTSATQSCLSLACNPRWVVRAD